MWLPTLWHYWILEFAMSGSCTRTSHGNAALLYHKHRCLNFTPKGDNKLDRSASVSQRYNTYPRHNLLIGLLKGCQCQYCNPYKDSRSIRRCSSKVLHKSLKGCSKLLLDTALKSRLEAREEGLACCSEVRSWRWGIAVYHARGANPLKGEGKRAYHEINATGRTQDFNALYMNFGVPYRTSGLL